LTYDFTSIKVESSQQHFNKEMNDKVVNNKVVNKKAWQPRSFYGPGKYVYAIYPDYWKESWGPKPLLGHVTADDEFYAEREAYSKNLLPVNFTFGPKAVKLYVAKQTNSTN
jgi:hypothetical protein